MKKLVILAIIVVVLLTFGCQKSKDWLKLNEIEARENLPIWSWEDFDYGDNLLVYKVTLYIKPPYYKGGMPFTFMQRQLPIPPFMSTTIVHSYEFDDYCVMFTQDRAGACAIDKDGELLLAEARLRYFAVEDEKTSIGIEAEEFHYGYNNDKGYYLTFYCKSLIDPITMHKISESECLGKKKKEYFFIWPSSF